MRGSYRFSDQVGWDRCEVPRAKVSSHYLGCAELIRRSGTSRGNKSSHDTDYKAILDFFVADLLSVLYRPEWPGASVYLTVLSRVLVCPAKSSALARIGY